MKEISQKTKSPEQLPESVMIFGCGYVGTALAKTLLSAGVRVGGLTRNPETAARLRAMGLHEVIEAELDNPKWVGELENRYEAAVNCVSSAGGGLAGYRKSYVDGQAVVMRWASEYSIQRYIYTSSTSVYPQDGGVVVDETADTSAAPETGKIIVESEAIIAENAAYFDKWFVLRLAGIYGPGRHYLMDQLTSGTTTIPGFGDYAMNMVHQFDIVSAIMSALDPNTPAESGVYNISDDHPETKEIVMAWLAESLGRTPPRFDPQSISPRLQRRGGRMPNRIILNTKAKAQLKWAPRYPSFREGYGCLLSENMGMDE